MREIKDRPRLKAIGDLAQYSDPVLLEAISVGLVKVLANAEAFWADCLALEPTGSHRGWRLLEMIAAEEAAKFLLLVDAVRCPRNSPAFGRHMRGFEAHLAKGIYADACTWKPADFKEVMECVELERRQYYLDGPSDVDWLMPDRIESEREQLLYVSYVDTDEGHAWWAPQDLGVFDLPPLQPADLTIARAMSTAGFTAPSALQVIAEIWRPVQMSPDFRWAALRELNKRTLESLDASGLLPPSADGHTVATLVNDWPYPLHSLDLRPSQPDLADLRARQERWCPP